MSTLPAGFAEILDGTKCYGCGKPMVRITDEMHDTMEIEELNKLNAEHVKCFE